MEHNLTNVKLFVPKFGINSRKI